MNKSDMSVKKIALVAVMTVLICVCSWLTVPFAVPFTMQTFAVFLALLLLGGREGTISVSVYVAMGAAGLPVFSGFGGGIGHILGPTGGYIIGFIFTGLCYMLLEPLAKDKMRIKILILALGLLLCYIAGTLWFYFVYAGRGEKISLLYVVSLCVLPYIIPDALKLILAATIASRLKKYIK